jgi:hypothetical protein
VTTALDPTLVTAPARPGRLRRTALVLAGVLAGALPTMWGLASLLELAGGNEPEHRFHQLTGQGLLLSFLWLYGVVRLAVAGWRGARPTTAAGLTHLAFVAGTVLCAATVSGQGVLFVAGVTVLTGGLLWLALPHRPGLRGALGGLDPLLTPLALLGAALYTPYVLAQRTLQATAHDSHADLTHYFDMAWVCTVVVLLACVAALAPRARELALPAGAGSLVIGLAGLAFTTSMLWSVLAIVLGGALLVVPLVRRAR